MTRPIPLAIFALLFGAGLAAAQQPRPEGGDQKPTIPADGTEVFQYLLDAAKLKPIKANETWNLGRMDDIVLIVLGRTDQNFNIGRPPMALAGDVVRSGGAVLIASDNRTVFNTLPNGFRSGAHLPSGAVYAGPNTGKASLFLGQKNMPFVVPLEPPPQSAAPEWSIFLGLEHIATNRPSFIRLINPFGEFSSKLATYPDDCEFADHEQGLGDTIKQDEHFFAVGGSGNPRRGERAYRFLAIADPNVFSNQMMMAADEEGKRVDNLRFGVNTVQYLVDRDDGQPRRTRCLLIQDGSVVENFDTLRRMMQPPMPMPDIMKMQEKLTDFANQIVDNFQTNDITNKIMLGTGESERDRRFRGFMWAVVGLLLFRAAYYLVKRIWASWRPGDGPPPPAGGLPALAEGTKPRGLFHRRGKELFRRNNLYEPVRLVVREMFLAAGGPEKPGKRLPEVEISDMVGRPETLVDALTDLWKIAYGPPRVVTVQRWKLLEPLFERVRQAHADGKWRFVQD